MAENSFPYYGVETNEGQFAAWSSLLSDTGVGSGLTLSAGAGMTVNVAAGSALVRGRYYENTASKSVTVAAAPGSGTRLDAIILRLDMTAKTITAVSKSGSTAGGGTLPTLQQDNDIWEMLLGVVTVASGTVSLTSGMIAQRRPVLGLPVYHYATTGERVDPPDAVALGVNTSTRVLSFWTGAAWLDIAVPYAAVTDPPTTPPIHDIDGDRHTGTLGIAKGGTGASTAAAARTALGAASTDASSLTSGVMSADRLPTVPISKGGTGATTKAAAREALGIFVRSTPLDGSNAVGDIRLW